MSKFWQVARYEYRKHVFKRSFLLVLFSVPAMLALMIGMGFLITSLEDNDDPLGYVDQAGVLVEDAGALPPDETEDWVPLISYPDEEQARAALDAGQIQAYYLIPVDYQESLRVELVYNQEPGENATAQFWDLMQLSLLTDQPSQIARRVVEGSDMIARSVDGSRQLSENDWINTLLPFLTGLAFLVLIFMSSGYLMQALVEEKENRTIEILVTSTSPGTLIGGKVLGIVGVTLTQLLAWVAFVVLAVWVGGTYFEITWLQNVHLDGNTMALMAMVLAPAYIFVAALMIAVGTTVSDAQEAQQMTGLFTLPIMMPYWLAAAIIQSPNSPLAVGLSLFPITAPATLTMRTAFTQVPMWQIGTSVALLTIFALGALWLAGRAFRLGMLRYGKRLRLSELIGRTRKR